MNTYFSPSLPRHARSTGNVRPAVRDADGDFAAVVYGRKDEPDRLLRDFTDDLGRLGIRVAGLIQTRMDNGAIGLTLLPTGETISVAQNPDRASADCHLDPGRLIEIGERVSSLISADTDLVVINRFGRLEADGMGLTQHIVDALDDDLPVVVAVPEYRFDEWLRFSGGMSIKLRCRRDSLQKWWDLLGRAERGGELAVSERFCELAK